jgi:hypothetical protein
LDYNSRGEAEDLENWKLEKLKNMAGSEGGS